MVSQPWQRQLLHSHHNQSQLKAPEKEMYRTDAIGRVQCLEGEHMMGESC
jgi:hypothetical protein